jgi:hypothetical protein
VHQLVNKRLWQYQDARYNCETPTSEFRIKYFITGVHVKILKNGSYYIHQEYGEVHTYGNDSTKWAHIQGYFNSPLNSATHLRILCSDTMSHSVTLRKWGTPSLRMITRIDKVWSLCSQIIRTQGQSVELLGTWQVTFAHRDNLWSYPEHDKSHFSPHSPFPHDRWNHRC